MNHEQITNNQVCGLQYQHPIYQEIQESKENEDELKNKK